MSMDIPEADLQEFLSTYKPKTELKPKTQLPEAIVDVVGSIANMEFEQRYTEEEEHKDENPVRGGS
jgi:hypothetical protein